MMSKLFGEAVAVGQREQQRNCQHQHNHLEEKPQAKRYTNAYSSGLQRRLRQIPSIVLPSDLIGRAAGQMQNPSYVRMACLSGDAFRRRLNMTHFTKHGPFVEFHQNVETVATQ